MERFAIKIDKKLKANLYKICRLCGIDNPEMVPILSDVGEKEKVVETTDVDAEPEMPQKIKLLIGLVVTKDDKMPQTMCSLCVDKINDFYEFREMCYATNTQTRKLLGLKNIKKIVPDIKPKVEIKEEELIVPKVGGKSLKTSPTTPIKHLKSTTMTKESRKRKQEEIALTPSLQKKESVVPVVSNKKLRLAAGPLKEAATKKAKQKNKEDSKDLDIKEEIKDEPKNDHLTLLPSTTGSTPTLAPGLQANNKFRKVCPICSERFATKAKLEAHTRLQHVPKIERFVCTACNETISKSFDIKNHQLWHKLSKTPYVCGLCGESIISTYAYARHIREHSIETPPAFLVLDRECPQCHVSYATNYLYNTHPCAVRTKRCAGCNRYQRSDAEFLKHSAVCAKVYLNYSKHIMPAVEAQEDAVRIKNENDVEAAAEEIARLTGVSLDMAPVVQLTRLSSPILMAANQCVSIPGLEDVPSTSVKKTSKKGVSKKELKRVDDLLKSTLDALVSIKHEPEVHVYTELGLAEGDLSDIDGHASDNNHAMDVGFQQDDDSDFEGTLKSKQSNRDASNNNLLSVKQEIGEIYEATKPEDGKLSSGGGLKLKIRKEHGQLNSSIIEQQNTDDRRGEKRKKKKKHKDKVKDKLKLQKESHEEQNSMDSFNTQNIEDNISSAESPTAVRIKTEPVEETNNDNSTAVQDRPQPEAMIMTSIPMMQLQIACISEGVDFNGSTTTAEEEPQICEVPLLEVSEPAEPLSAEDVKPNLEALDRILQISHISSGVSMDTNELETQLQQSANVDGNENNNQRLEEMGEDEIRDESEDNKFEAMNEVRDSMQTIVHNHGDEYSDILPRKKIDEFIKPKSTKHKTTPKIVSVKSRNKACKSTAKPNSSNLSSSALQISVVQSGVSLNANSLVVQNNSPPVFIKPEPQNRGYSDEQVSATLSPPISPKPDHRSGSPKPIPDHIETVPAENLHLNNEEQEYISTIDFNNITVKQEKDLDIEDVQFTNSTRYFKYSMNGMKARKTVGSIQNKKNTLSIFNETKDMEQEDDALADNNVGEKEEMEEEMSEEDDEETDTEYDEDNECEEEEEREYRELEYPPELKKDDGYEDSENFRGEKLFSNLENYRVANKDNNDCSTPADNIVQKEVGPSEKHLTLQISAVCSQVPECGDNNDCSTPDDNIVQKEVGPSEKHLTLQISAVCSQVPECGDSADFTMKSNHKQLAQLNIGGCEKLLTSSQSNEAKKTSDQEEINLSKTAHERFESENDSGLVIDKKPAELNRAPATSHSFTSELRHSQSEILIRQELSIGDNEAQRDSSLHYHSVKGGDPCAKNTLLKEPEHDLTEKNESYSHFAGGLNDERFECLNPATAGKQNMEGAFNYDGLLSVTKTEKIVSNYDQPMRDQTTNKMVLIDPPIDGLNIQNECDISTQLNFTVQETVVDSFESLGQNTGSISTSESLKTLPNLDTEFVSETDYSLRQDSTRVVENTTVVQYSSNFDNKPNLQSSYHSNQIPTKRTTMENTDISIQCLSDDIEHVSVPQCTGSQTIAGIIDQTNEVQLEAKPVLQPQDNIENSCANQEESHEINVGADVGQDNFQNETDEDAEEESTEDSKKEDTSGAIKENETLVGLNLNLEEHQNQQNQQTQRESQTDLARPTALSLHPYLEDISSSSSSFLSNNLSQTPPPTQSTSSNSHAHPATSHYTEETENILNESSAAHSRRASFNFDNINEIAENNNNANLEREQLQDDQQQHNILT